MVRLFLALVVGYGRRTGATNLPTVLGQVKWHFCLHQVQRIDNGVLASVSYLPSSNTPLRSLYKLFHNHVITPLSFVYPRRPSLS